VIETIIVPLDGSALAESALPLALEISEKFGVELILVRAIEAPSGVPTAGLLDPPAAVAAEIELAQKVREEARKDAQSYLDAVVQRLAPATADAQVVDGDPEKAIVATAAGHPGALIVMSSRGRGGVGRLVFGSVAEAVLRDSAAPVLIVKSTQA
jgi:nucleotide-binding universal stress UspA family protein